MPVRAWMGWLLWVLALHAWLLWSWPQAQPVTAPAGGPLWTTRSIALPPPAPPPAPEPSLAPPAQVALPEPLPAPARPRKRPPVPKSPPAPEPESISASDSAPHPEPRIELDIPTVDEAQPEFEPQPLADGDPAVQGPAAPEPAATEATSQPSFQPSSADMPPIAPPSVSTAPTAELPPLPHGPAPDPGLRIVGSADGGGARGDGPPPLRIPPPMRLSFAVEGLYKGFQYNASAELLWQHDGQNYQARQEVRAFLIGSRTQTSVGHLGPWGVQPRRFGDKSRSEQAAHFDFDAGRVTFSANTPSAPIVPGAQDRLSVFIELAALVAGAPERYTPGTEIALTTVSARSAGRWVFRVEGREALELPAGALQALHLQRVLQDPDDQGADLWLSPALGYLPVRLLLTQSNGNRVDLQLKESGVP